MRPSSLAIIGIISKMCATIALFSGVISSTPAMWVLGITRMCVGAIGAMSRNASTWSSSKTFVEGISPEMILQNKQSFMILSS